MLDEVFAEEPALNYLLSVPGTSVQFNRLKILGRISNQPWFSVRFAEAGGFAWLENEIGTLATYDSFVEMLTNAAISCRSLSYLTQFVDSIREYLTRQPQTKNLRYKHLAHQLNTIIREKTGQTGRFEPDARGSSTEATYRAQCGTAIHQDTQAWTQSELQYWKIYMTEVVNGLKCGYIVDEQPRIITDPEGICQRNRLCCGSVPQLKASNRIGKEPDADTDDIWELLYPDVQEIGIDPA